MYQECKDNAAKVGQKCWVVFRPESTTVAGRMIKHATYESAEQYARGYLERHQHNTYQIFELVAEVKSSRPPVEIKKY